MKTDKKLLTDLENIGVFEFKNGIYMCKGYNIDITILFVDLHKSLDKKIRLTEYQYRLDKLALSINSINTKDIIDER